MIRTLLLVTMLCAALFHADAATSLRRLRTGGAGEDEISAQYLNLANEADNAALIQQRRVQQRQSKMRELKTRELGANPGIDMDEDGSMSYSMSLGDKDGSMSYSMSLSMSMA